MTSVIHMGANSTENKPSYTRFPPKQGREHRGIGTWDVDARADGLCGWMGARHEREMIKISRMMMKFE
jgi:hypothetical protein